MGLAEISGYLAAGLVFLTFYMRTMIPLRVVGLASNLAFIGYGVMGGLIPILVLHLALLPLNAIRLWQMLQLGRELDAATRGDLGLDWIKPFTHTRHAEAGETVFDKGDTAEEMYVVVYGRFRLVETGLDVHSGDVVGEFGLVTPDSQRTQTLVCEEAGSLLRITYRQVQQLILSNPQLAFYFMKLITGRLMQNNRRLEEDLIGRQRSAGQKP